MDIPNADATMAHCSAMGYAMKGDEYRFSQATRDTVLKIRDALAGLPRDTVDVPQYIRDAVDGEISTEADNVRAFADAVEVEEALAQEAGPRTYIIILDDMFRSL